MNPAGEKFEPTHVGCYDEIEERPARQSGLLFQPWDEIFTPTPMSGHGENTP
jgi:hypothetical protein